MADASCAAERPHRDRPGAHSDSDASGAQGLRTVTDASAARSSTNEG
eukprot:CAMPEP_0174857234 /NCGR_PEP_ID=MMETSP1114-20130205/38087_1 /TAXON_ID=312471 /ORGANISM="Neobodo designis, Strain CCAP 1951/1" /LENGTH=46 /DNA_ID= /DNA_START= /DNA_END= /DNA_ORIENTATION=